MFNLIQTIQTRLQDVSKCLTYNLNSYLIHILNKYSYELCQNVFHSILSFFGSNWARFWILTNLFNRHKACDEMKVCYPQKSYYSIFSPKISWILAPFFGKFLEIGLLSRYVLRPYVSRTFLSFVCELSKIVCLHRIIALNPF